MNDDGRRNDGRVIDIEDEPLHAPRWGWRAWAVVSLILLFLVAPRLLGIAVTSLWFDLPVYDMVSGWLSGLALIVLVVALCYAGLATAQRLTDRHSSLSQGIPNKAFAAVSWLLALWLGLLAWGVSLSRYSALWEDHTT